MRPSAAMRHKRNKIMWNNERKKKEKTSSKHICSLSRDREWAAAAAVVALERDGKTKNMILIYKNYNSFSLLLLYLYYDVRTYEGYTAVHADTSACTEHPITSIDLVIVVLAAYLFKGVTSVWTHTSHCGFWATSSVCCNRTHINLTGWATQPPASQSAKWKLLQMIVIIILYFSLS